MNDLQIEYFLAAARNMSFSKAAQELFVSQPAISRQILALEPVSYTHLFARADEIRDELAAMGIILKDTREGVTWKRA